MTSAGWAKEDRALGSAQPLFLEETQDIQCRRSWTSTLVFAPMDKVHQGTVRY